MVHKIVYLREYFPFLGKNGKNPTVEVFLPNNMTEMNRQDRKRPCLVICPGGGYEMCSQREGEPVAVQFLPEGFNVFVLTYSVAPHRFPAQLCEVAGLLELIYQKAEEWNCDTGKICIMGFSAGGHLAAMYSTRYSSMEIREVFPKSKPVNACVLCYPVITANPYYCHSGSFDNLLGTTERTDGDITYFSCESHVWKDTPPTFLWHMSADKTVPVMNSLLYATMLSKYQIPFELHIYPDGWHGTATCDEQTIDAPGADVARASEWIPAAKKWLNSIGIKL